MTNRDDRKVADMLWLARLRVDAQLLGLSRAQVAHIIWDEALRPERWGIDAATAARIDREVREGQSGAVVAPE